MNAAYLPSSMRLPSTFSYTVGTKSCSSLDMIEMAPTLSTRVRGRSGAYLWAASCAGSAAARV
jgi:hypothetical protein